MSRYSRAPKHFQIRQLAFAPKLKRADAKDIEAGQYNFERKLQNIQSRKGEHIEEQSTSDDSLVAVRLPNHKPQIYVFKRRYDASRFRAEVEHKFPQAEVAIQVPKRKSPRTSERFWLGGF